MGHCPWKAEPHGVLQNSRSRVNIHGGGDRRSTTKQRKKPWQVWVSWCCLFPAESLPRAEQVMRSPGAPAFAVWPICLQSCEFFFLDWQEWRTLVLWWVYNGCLDVIYWSFGIAVLSNYFFPPAWRAPFAFRLTSCCLFELVPLNSKHPGFCEIKAGLVKVKGK